MRAREFFLAVGLVVGVMSSAPVATHASNAENTLRDGAWALQFRIGDDFALSSFKGSVVSAKYHHSDRSALRLGFSTSFSFGDLEEGVTGDVNAEPRSGDDEERSMTVDFQYLHYASSAHWAHPFFGAGPVFGYFERESSLANESTSQSQFMQSWFAGLAGTLGVELFPASGIGVHAEYGVSLGYRSTEEQAASGGRVNSREADSWRLRGEGVLFGVSVYF